MYHLHAHNWTEEWRSNLIKILEAQRDAVEKHIEELLKLGVVRPSRSKYNSPIFVVNCCQGLRNVYLSRHLSWSSIRTHTWRSTQWEMNNSHLEAVSPLSSAGAALCSHHWCLLRGHQEARGVWGHPLSGQTRWWISSQLKIKMSQKTKLHFF